MAANDVQVNQMDAQKQEIDKMHTALVERQQSIYQNVGTLNSKDGELAALHSQIQYAKREIEVL